ncbi:MAG: LptF/LptG family permease [Tannerella sp.]|jgi:lipopolysaccharide export system permease protein|nr:LptF/LptG family permease [Tannerella sp.]
MQIKRLDIFLLKTFLPLFIMTFGICLFIVLMQFLWKYVDEMVGKGFELNILGELFFYAALAFVPMSLPIAVLLASLMTFGNLGEQFELLAIKSSGISLLRIMRPLTVFLCAIAVGSFCFQDHAIPSSQVKFWTLLYSMRMKSPELDIPESTFTNDISGYNLYVKKKDKNGLLKDVMIYVNSGGFDNLKVIVADSGRLKMSADKNYLILTLYNGESFGNQRAPDRANPIQAVPYQKEFFLTKEYSIRHNANFTRQDESIWEDRHIGKNLAELRHSIDSMTLKIDSIKVDNSMRLYSQSHRQLLTGANHNPSNPQLELIESDTIKYNIEDIFRTKERSGKLTLLSNVKMRLEGVQNDYLFKSNILAGEEKKMRQHHTEMHKKFALSFACLIFFFIGAPLGAIIRKGGLGLPTVISVALYISYYILDTIGLKMTVNGMWQPWLGMWFSSYIFLPLGIFLTYKSTNDSAILHIDTYVDGLKKIIGKRTIRKVEVKEIILNKTDYSSFESHITDLKNECAHYCKQNQRWVPYFTFWKQGCNDPIVISLAGQLEKLVEEGRNSDQKLIVNKLMDFPILDGYVFDFHLNEKTGKIIGSLFPVAVVFYLFAIYRRKLLKQDIHIIQHTCDELLEIVNKL